MKRMLLALEPVIWLLFSAGMMVGGLLLPAWALVMGVAGPLGIASTATSYDHFYAVASHPLGRLVQIGNERYRVIGVMEAKGQFLGIDLDDTAYIPAARALSLYNRTGLMEINVTYEEGVPAARVTAEVRKILVARHGREEWARALATGFLR